MNVKHIEQHVVDLPQQFPFEFTQQRGAVVLSATETHVEVGISAIDDFALRQEITRFFAQNADEHCSQDVSFIEVDSGEMASFIQQVALKDISADGTNASISDQSIDRLANNAPIINLVNNIILESIRNKASDIHIEMLRNGCAIRIRLDGELITARTLDARLFPGLSTRLKIMAGLNIMESRRPQDGRISVSLKGTFVDIRMSVIPTSQGESLVLRLLSTENKPRSLTELGFQANNYQSILKAIHQPQGLIIFTGPTGSGKTTSLAAVIGELNDRKRKIITIEDPVEFEIEGVDQIQVNNEAGVTFNNTLRRILRQDPNVIMVGEVRDEDTAQLCIRAAMTGHVVLSSLHTNSAISSVQRLADMEIQPFLLSSLLRLVVAQRLVRRLCPHCKQPASSQNTEHFHALIQRHGAHMVESDIELFEAREGGCPHCKHTGYSGRIVIEEVLPVTSELAMLIEKGAGQGEYQQYLSRISFQDMAQSALKTAGAGITSLDEIQKHVLMQE